MTVTAFVSLWMVDADTVTDADLQRYRDWLTPSELARHQRFVRMQRQRQFILGRALLRMALGQLLNVTPQEVRLEEQVGQAPSLSAPILKEKQPGFSISHGGRWVACAVSAQTALGLDIELRDASRDLSALATQAFDTDEMAQWTRIQHLSNDERIDGFYRLWSEKEARFKLNQANQANSYCITLPHPELSIVICSEIELAIGMISRDIASIV